MLDAKKVADIEKLAADARFGYATVNTQIYYRDVSALLAERQELLLGLADLRKALTEAKGLVEARADEEPE